MAVGLELVSEGAPVAADGQAGAIRDLDQLLAGMRPSLQRGRYAFTTLPPGQAIDPASIVASIREAEGLSVILTEDDALALGLPIAFTAAWITLEVHSDLAAVGLTAAFSQALARFTTTSSFRPRRPTTRSPCCRPCNSGPPAEPLARRTETP